MTRPEAEALVSDTGAADDHPPHGQNGSGQRALVAVGFAFASSVAHYTDNYVRYAKYFPDGTAIISRSGVYVAWLAFSVVAVAAVVLLPQKPRLAAALLCAYSVSGIVGPLHYLYAPFTSFDALQHALIAVDLASGLVLAAAAYHLVGSRISGGDGAFYPES